MLIYEILLGENEGDIIIPEKLVTLNKLAEYQMANHPDKPFLSVPRIKRIEFDIEADIDEAGLDAISREISKADDIQVRGKGW